MFYVALLAILLPIQNNLPFRSLNLAVLVRVGMIKLKSAPFCGASVPSLR